MRNLLGIILTSLVFLSTTVQALPAIKCADLKAYDAENALHGAFSIFSGCEPQSAETIQNVYKQWPIAFQIWARRKFHLEQDSYPTPKELESLKNGLKENWGTEDKFLALQLMYELEVYPSEWAEKLAFKNATNSVEQLLSAYNGWWHYFEYIDPNEIDQVEILNLFRTTDIPLLKAAFGWEELNGSSLSFDLEGGLLKIQTAISNGWISQIHWATEAYLDNSDSLDDTQEKIVIDLIKKAAKDGSISAQGQLARWIFEGFIDASNPYNEAARIWENLALYGYPLAQSEIADRYEYGEGVPKNEKLAILWRTRAARAMNRDSLKRMFDEELSNQNIEAALQYSLLSAQSGYFSIDERGYAIASLLLPHVTNDQTILAKLKDFLKSHCHENLLITEKENCEKLPGKIREFKAVANLQESFEDPNKRIQYASNIDLKTGKFKALVIANQNYTDWDPLDTPLADAQELGNLLKTKYNFDVTYLTDGSRRDTLRAIYDQSKSLQFNDHFLIFYAGHGIIDRSTDTAYWIPTDAPRDFQPDWISSDEIMNALKAVNARHVILIADSCYSGKLLRGAAQVEKNPDSALIERLFSKKAKVAITSGGLEPVADSVGGSKNSVFAEALITTLQKVDSPTPASTIFNEILGKVSLKVEQTPQYADMRELDHDGGDFIFVPSN